MCCRQNASSSLHAPGEASKAAEGGVFCNVPQEWLGIETVNRAALWALFFGWGISVIQVQPPRSPPF